MLTPPVCPTVVVRAAALASLLAAGWGCSAGKGIDSAPTDTVQPDTACVAEPPVEECSEEANYNLYGCGTCDLLWFCSRFDGGGPRWEGGGPLTCECLTESGGRDTANAECRPDE